MPSAYPLLYKDECLEECPDGAFFYEGFCFECFDVNCVQCEGYASNQCAMCAEGFLLQDGICVLSCDEGVRESDGRCVGEVCVSECEVCSRDSEYCFQCKEGYAVVEGLGECVSQCPAGFFHFLETGVCEPCHYLCAECLDELQCTSCDPIYDKVFDPSEKYCLDECSAKLYLNQETNICEYCHEDCYECSGPSATECISCIGELYFYENTCLQDCPEGLSGNSEENICEISTSEEKSSTITPPIFIYISLSFISLVISVITHFMHGSFFNTFYPLLSATEFFGRLIILICVLSKTSYLFCLSVMAIGGTSSLALYLHNFYLEPMLKMDKELRPIFFRQKNSILITIYLSFIFGPNYTRILSSNVLGLKHFQFKLHSLILYRNPVNLIGNMNLVLCGIQIILNLICIFRYNMEDWVFGTACCSIVVNIVLVILQILDMVSVRKFVQYSQVVRGRVQYPTGLNQRQPQRGQDDDDDARVREIL